MLWVALDIKSESEYFHSDSFSVCTVHVIVCVGVYTGPVAVAL